MSFPKNSIQQYNLIQPSTDKKIAYRSFLVGEQKQLLMAVNGNSDDMLLAMKNTVDACTFGKLDVQTLPNFDLEYIFLQIRARSIGESVDLIVSCDGCGTKNDYNLNLTDVQVHKNPDHNTKIMLSDNLGVVMRYPTTEEVTLLNEHYSTENVFQVLLNCIKTVFDDEQVTETEDESREELIDFVDTLTTKQMDKLENFFKTMPELKHEFKHTCKKCGHVTEYVMEGFENFFV